jgi:DNA-binding NtrC family response regulator
LLRVLQDRMVERVGGDKPMRVDFRLCSATNRDLEQFVEQGRFRLDLFYRISPVIIVLPSLDTRKEDIPLLLNHFAAELAKQYNRPVPEVDMNLPQYLMERSWPGNVRQLRHAVERAFVFADQGRLSISDFQQDTSHSVARPQPLAPDQTELAASARLLKESKDDLEYKLINDAMIRFKGNKKKTAEHLGISRSYLYKKLGEVL